MLSEWGRRISILISTADRKNNIFKLENLKNPVNNNSLMDIEWIHLQRKLKNEKKKPRDFLKMYCHRWEMESKHGEVIDKRTHLEDSVRWGKDNGNDDEKIPRWAASRVDEINSSHFLTTLVQVQNIKIKTKKLKVKQWGTKKEQSKRNYLQRNGHPNGITVVFNNNEY